MIQQIKNNILDAYTHPELALTNLEAKQLLANLKDGKFNHLDYNGTPSTWVWFSHLKCLAELAGNKTILYSHKPVILQALQLFLNNNPSAPHEWYHQIGLPRYLGRLYLLLEDALSDSDKITLLSYIQKGSLCANPQLLTKWWGTNLLWVAMNGIQHAIISQDLSKISAYIDAVTKELVYHKNYEYGIQADYSFIPYPNQFYINETPYTFTRGYAYLVYVLQGTEYQIPVDALWVLGFYFVFGLRYHVRNKYCDYLTVGKDIIYPDALFTEKLRQTMWMYMQVNDMVCRDVMSEQLASLSYEMYSLKTDKYSYFTNNYTSRRVISHISCQGTSPTTKLDFNNMPDNGITSNFYAGGATCIMSTGKEYENIIPVWDFAHIPGTTTPEEINKEFCKIQNAYCGGFSYNECGALYQDLNFNGVTGVTARFFIDGMMIALGANISCDKAIPVTTTLNQCWQTEQPITFTQGIYQDHTVYVSFDEQQIQVTSTEKEGNWSTLGGDSNKVQKGVVSTFAIPHGVQPKGATYAYGIIPAVAEGSAKERLEQLLSEVKILQNNETVQAIQYKNDVFCVFHQNGMYHIDRYSHFVANGPSVHVFHI